MTLLQRCMQLLLLLWTEHCQVLGGSLRLLRLLRGERAGALLQHCVQPLLVLLLTHSLQVERNTLVSCY